jgi:hypothetical protein
MISYFCLQPRVKLCLENIEEDLRAGLSHAKLAEKVLGDPKHPNYNYIRDAFLVALGVKLVEVMTMTMHDDSDEIREGKVSNDLKYNASTEVFAFDGKSTKFELNRVGLLIPRDKHMNEDEKVAVYVYFFCVNFICVQLFSIIFFICTI